MFLVFMNLILEPLEWFPYAYFCLSLTVLSELLKVLYREIKYIIRLQSGFNLADLLLLITEINGNIISVFIEISDHILLVFKSLIFLMKGLL